MRFLPSRTDRRVFGEIAEEYDLVYFGTVDPRVDTDYKAVRGLTMSSNMKDENYTTGNVYDYEVAFLQRNKKVCMSDFCRKFKWTILQVQLKNSNLPHIFIDARERMTVYGEMLLSALRMPEIGYQNFASDMNFAQKFALYAQPQELLAIQQIMTPEAQTMLATHFPDFSYELQGDTLIIYSTATEINLQTLDHMLRVGLWWARYLDQPKI